MASLRDELAEAQLDMNDTVYDHEYELRTEGLDSLSEDIQTAFDNMVERLQRNHDERDKLLSELLTPVGNKSTEIAALLQGVVDANGLVVEITDKDNSLKANLISAESIQALDEFSDSILNFKDFNASTELTKIAEQLTAISDLDTTSVYSNLKNFKEIYDQIVEIGTANTTYEDKGKTPNGNSSTVPNEGKDDPKPDSSSNNTKNHNKNYKKTTSYSKEQKANYKTRIDNYLARNGKKYNKKTKYGELNTALGEKTGFVLDEKHRKDLAKHLGTTEKELYKFLKDIGYLPSLKSVGKGTTVKGKVSQKTTVSGKFAKGTKKVPKDMLGITQDAGQEVIYRKSDGAMLTPLGKGDKVFTAQMTDNLWKLAQNASLNNNGLSNLSAPIINNVNTSSPTININFENFMTVQGNVDKEAITDIKKFKSEMVDEFTKTMTNEMNLLGHKFRF